MRSCPAPIGSCLLAVAVAVASTVVGCAKVSQEDIRKTLEANPDIILGVLEKNKDKLAKLLIDFDADKVVDELVGENATKLEKALADEGSASSQRYTPELEAGRPMLGLKDAPVTLVIYSDFECPYCAEAAEAGSKIVAKYPTQVRLFFKHLIGESHVGARPAARMFEALARQGDKHAFAFHDVAFKAQDKLDDLGANDAPAHEAFFKKLATELAPDKNRFEKDLKGTEVDARLRRDDAEAARFKFDSTPRFLVNGELIDGAATVEELDALVQKHLKPSAAPATPAAPAKK